VPTDTPDTTADPNDFHYDLDPVGRQCPLFAHIRKTNPRGDVPRYIRPGTEEFERARRIVRRGITYGERPDLAQPPTGGATFRGRRAAVHVLRIGLQPLRPRQRRG
jgi:deferrochelatase/peroxidase EfeB